MDADEALARCVELGERRQAALDELDAVRYELPKLVRFATRSRGITVKTVAQAVGVRRETIWRWMESGDAVGWYVWSPNARPDPESLPTLD